MIWVKLNCSPYLFQCDFSPFCALSKYWSHHAGDQNPLEVIFVQVWLLNWCFCRKNEAGELLCCHIAEATLIILKLNLEHGFSFLKHPLTNINTLTKIHSSTCNTQNDLTSVYFTKLTPWVFTWHPPFKNTVYFLIL